MISQDILYFLDKSNVVEYVEFLEGDKNNVILQHVGQEITNFLDIDLSKRSGTIDWQGTICRFVKVDNAMGKGYLLYITRCDYNLAILEKALDRIPEGVQVFDQKGYLMFYNQASEEIEKMDRRNIVGKHLMDIYDLNEGFSTILSTLKNKNSVRYRCDVFKNKNGEMIKTMNSGYPIFIGNHLAGAVGIIHDTNVLKSQRQAREEFEKFFSADSNKNNQTNNKNYYGVKNYEFDDLIGQEANFLEEMDLARNIACRDCSVLIWGETGTGKELFAQSIHSASNRRSKEFVAINCAAIPENLVEGILFGTEKGSFTGSIDRIGLFEQAEGGTLFLDEVNAMDLHTQSKLLRVLQENKFRRVGGLQDIKCDVRIISSSNEDPFTAIENNRIRKDVYYRISTVTINIPSLRERKGDISLLVDYFIERFSFRYGKRVSGLSAEVTAIFKKYNWPGNVRELVHVIEYVFNMVEGERVEKLHLPKYMRQFAGDKIDNIQTKNDNRKNILHQQTLQEQLDSYEKEILESTLERCNNNVTKAAGELGLVRQSMQYRMKKFNL